MKYRCVFFFALILVLFVGCGQSLQQELIGKWTEAKGACHFSWGSNASVDFSQIEFLSSTAIINGVTTGYSFLDSQRINLQIYSAGIALTVSIQGNQLTLTDQTNEACLLNRVS